MLEQLVDFDAFHIDWKPMHNYARWKTNEKTTKILWFHCNRIKLILSTSMLQHQEHAFVWMYLFSSKTEIIMVFVVAQSNNVIAITYATALYTAQERILYVDIVENGIPNNNCILLLFTWIMLMRFNIHLYNRVV